MPNTIETGADLTEEQWQAYGDVVRRAREALGIKRLGLIAPIRSLPVDKENDTGIGSLSAAKPFFEFVTRLGFDVVQIDPEGKTKLFDPSPYSGTVFSTNPMTIDLAPLASEAWGTVLSAETLSRIRKENPKQGLDEVAYAYAFKAQDEALAEAYGNLKKLPAELKKRFEAFKKSNESWLTPDALYEALTLEYGTDFWPAWKGPNARLDRNLFYDADKKKAETRIAELQKKYTDVIGTYQFAQFLASEQKQAFKEFSKKHNFAVMADRQVGLSDRDVWAYQSLFLREWALGAPPDYFSAYGQAWGFPVFDPEKLFNADGSLGEGGLLLKRLYEKIFEENPGGVRIDHIIGLIDPWVYPANAKSTRDGARLFSSPEHAVLGKYSYIEFDALDPEKDDDNDERVSEGALTDAVIEKYAQIMDKVVIPAAKAKGVPLTSIICEDLGTLTNPVKAVMKARGYSGIRVTQFVDAFEPTHFYRGANVEAPHWITTGTHDNEPILLWATRQLEAGGDTLKQHAKNLAEDLIPDDAAREAYAQQLATDALALARAKFAELFASPSGQVQLFFTDLFGMETPYNRPSTASNENWVLRIPQDYTGAYFGNLAAGKALNLPEALAVALRARGDESSLVAELDQHSEILKG